MLRALCRSPVGRFKLPQAPGKHQEQLRYAIFSCSNWVSSGLARNDACGDCGEHAEPVGWC